MLASFVMKPRASYMIYFGELVCKYVTMWLKQIWGYCAKSDAQLLQDGGVLNTHTHTQHERLLCPARLAYLLPCCILLCWVLLKIPLGSY